MSPRTEIDWTITPTERALLTITYLLREREAEIERLRPRAEAHDRLVAYQREWTRRRRANGTRP